MANKERENFYKNSTLIVDHTKNSLIDLLELHLSRQGLSLEDFINTHQHEIYHLCYNTRRCCQCTPGYILPPHRVLYPSQLELLLDKYGAALSCHAPGRRTDFCCCLAKPGVTTHVLDITLTRTLLVNFCAEIFWYSCLNLQSITLEDFLNQHKHHLYHLMDCTPCCQCTPGYVFPVTHALLKPHHWSLLFSNPTLPCVLHRMVPSTNICCVSASSGVFTSSLGNELTNIILEQCCSLRRTVNKLVQMRNNVYGHATEGRISDTDYTTYKTEIESGIMGIATVCGKETVIKQSLLDLQMRSLDETLCVQYQNTMLEQILKEKSLEQKVDELATQLPQTVTSAIKDAMAKDDKLTEDQRKRRDQFKETTLNQIKHHVKDETFVETHLIPHTLEKLERNSIVILTGTTGVGKSRNSLELLRRYCTDHEGYYAISLPKLSEWSGLINADDKVVVWIDDVFGRTNSTFMDDDTRFLDIVSATLSDGYVKLILTMRNSIKLILSDVTDCHQIFKPEHFIDLSADVLQMNRKEKEQCLLQHCNNNNIYKSNSYGDDQTNDDTAILDPSSKVYLSYAVVNGIVNTDVCPLLGFPQSCYLFASNRKFTRQGVAFFKHPTQTLCDEINNLRVLGKKDDSKALEYAILVHIVLNGDTLSLGTVNCRKIRNILESVYGSSRFNPSVSAIRNSVIKLSGRYLHMKGDNSVVFQHRIIFESVLLSYEDIDPCLIISFLEMDSLLELGCLDNYASQIGEVKIKFYPESYKPLASKFVSQIVNTLYPNNFIKKLCASKFIRNGNKQFLKNLYSVYKESKHDVHVRMVLMCKTQSDINIERSFAIDSGSYDQIPDPIRQDYVFTFLESLLRYSSNYTDNNIVVRDLLELIGKDAETKNKVYLAERYSECLTLCILKACASLNIERLKKMQTFIDRYSIELDEHVISSFSIGRKGNIVQALKLMVSLFKDYEMIDATIILGKVIAADDFDLLKFMIDKYEDRVNFQKATMIACKMGKVDVVAWFCLQYKTEIDDVNSMMLTSCENGRQVVVEYLLENFSHDMFSLDAAIDKANNKNYSDIVYILITQCKHPFNVYKIMETLSKKAYSVYSINTTDWCPVVKHLLQRYDISRFDLKSVVEVVGGCTDSSILELLLQLIDVNSFYSIWINAKRFHKNRTLALKHIINSSECRFDKQILIDKEVNYGNTEGIKCILDNCDLKSLNIKRVIDFGCYRKPNLILWMFEKFDHCQFDLGYILEKSLKTIRDQLEIAEWMVENIDLKVLDMNSIINNVSEYSSKQNFSWILNTIDHKLYNCQSVMETACRFYNRNAVELLIDMFGVAIFQPEKVIKFALGHLGRGNFVDIIKTLLKNVNSIDYNLIDIMNGACSYNKTELVEWLMEHYSPANFHIHCAVNKALQCRQTLKYFLSRFDHIFLDIESIIRNLCKMKKFDMVEWILDRFDQSLFDMDFIMNKACQSGQIRLVQWMFANCKTNTFNIKYVVEGACEHESCDLLAWIFDNLEITTFEIENVKDYSFRNVIFLIENWDQSKLNFHNIMNYLAKILDKEIYIEFLRCLLEVVNHKYLDKNHIFNHGCRYGTIHFVNWLMNTVDHNFLDLESAINNAIQQGDLEIVISILKSKPRNKAKNIVNTAFTEACRLSKLQIVDWLITNFDLNFFNVSEASSCIRAGDELIERIIVTFDHNLIDFNLIMKSEYVKKYNGAFPNWLRDFVSNKIVDPESVMKQACNEKYTAWGLVKFMLDTYDFRLFDMKLVLDTACRTASLDIVKWLVINCDVSVFDMNSALQNACRNGLDIVIFLIESFVKVLDIQTALKTTVGLRSFNYEIIKYLLMHIEPTVPTLQLVIDNCCKVPTSLADWITQSFDCHEIDVNSTINKIFDMNPKPSCYEPMIEFLLKHFGYKRFDMTTVILRMCKMRFLRKSVFKVLRNVEPSLYDAREVLSEVCQFDDLDIVEYLIDTGSFEEVVDEDFILNSFNTKTAESIIWLVNKFQHVSFDKTVAMNNACMNGNVRLVQWLILKNGTKSFDVKSAMNTACEYGGLELVQWLLQILPYETFDMEAAMNIACKSGRLDIVKWLLAVYDIELFNMKTAIKVSEENQKDDLAKWCREKIHLE